MCTKDQLKTIQEKIIESYKSVYGNNIIQIILYGSYARGDYDSQSDIDITAVVDGERLDLQKKLRLVWDASADIGLENDIVISPTVIPASEFELYKNKLPYYRNIDKEGIRI